MPRLILIALALILQSCAFGDTLGCALRPVGQSSGDRVEDLRCLAVQGDRNAQFSLAHAYETGAGVAPDMKQAIRWYRRAAEPAPVNTFADRPGDRAPVGARQHGSLPPVREWGIVPGDAGAQFRLGQIYLEGRGGIKQDEKKARKWLSRAAGQGYEPAIELLAGIEKE